MDQLANTPRWCFSRTRASAAGAPLGATGRSPTADRMGSCRAVRALRPAGDPWAPQSERMPGPGMQVATSLTVASPRGQPTRIGVGVHDRSVIPGAPVEEYPFGLVSEIAGRMPLLQKGRPFVRDPVVLGTEEAMGRFLRRLVDPARDMSFAVASIPPEGPRADKLADQWTALARALAGLAVVCVLPPPPTVRLIDAVGRSPSAFEGAWGSTVRDSMTGRNGRGIRWRWRTACPASATWPRRRRSFGGRPPSNG